MCDVPNTAAFHRESIECFPGIVYRFFGPLVTIPVAPIVTGMTKHFIFYYILISFKPPLYCIQASCICLVFNYYVWSIDQNLFVPLRAIELIHPHIHIPP